MLLLAASVAGCSPLGMAVGAGASAGIAASEERGIGGSLADARIQTDINDLWFKHSIEMMRRLELTVNEGRVLVAGFAEDEKMKADAVRLVWQVKGVRAVEDQVKVGPEPGTGSYLRDIWIGGQLRSILTFDGHIQAINYTIESVDGVVYLMGIAQSEAELERVVGHARRQRYVKRVVSLVRIKVQMPEPPARPSPPPGPPRQPDTVATGGA